MTTMDYTTTLRAVKKLKVQTGSLACVGCGYEHNCSLHGCAILRNAAEHMEAALANYDLDRLRELVEADRDGRCLVLPSGGYTDKDGENALKSAMNTCFYHNNPVTRYIADAVAEKLTREAAEATLKGDK